MGEGPAVALEQDPLTIPPMLGEEDQHRARGAFWRSPPDQPPWARPTLLVVAALAGLSYAWGIGNSPLEPFYAAAARSMADSWRDFFFGGVDPFGTVTLDKLPGAVWTQALSVRLFGFHYWSVALPQAVAGVLTVLVLYRAVRRLVGPKAGLVAAVVIAASPITALTNRGNVSDSWLVLLTVLAADATSRAVTTGRLRTLVVAGVWVGLAFQTKMLQAWLVVPALFLTYLVAAPPSLRRRVGHVALAGVAVVAVSLSWMSVVAVTPAHDRPYVDGTSDNSIYVQVFVYNGWSRIGIHADADKLARPGEPFLRAASKNSLNAGTRQIGPSWHRLLSGPLGRDDGWLLPAALVAAVGVMMARRKAGRRDPIRAAVILWSGWLVTLFAFFSGGTFVNSYYTAALVPPIAALCATGLAVAWRSRVSSRTSRAVLLVVVAGSTLYAISLIPNGAGVSWWLIPLAVVVCGIAVLALLSSFRRDRTAPGGDAAIVMSALSLLLVPAVTTGVVVADGLGSFSTPYQPAATTEFTTLAPQKFQQHGAEYAAYFRRNYPGTGMVAVYDTSALAAGNIMVTGREFLPIGGYNGADPSPTLATLEHLIRTHQVRKFDVPLRPAGTDARVAWVRTHCKLVNEEPFTARAVLGVYDCAERPTAGQPGSSGDVIQNLGADSNLTLQMLDASEQYAAHGYSTPSAPEAVGGAGRAPTFGSPQPATRPR